MSIDIKKIPSEKEDEESLDTEITDEASKTEEEPEETVEEAVEEKSSDKNEQTPDTKPKKHKKVRAPIIIAACIFLCTVLGFAVWKCFFDTSILGSWTLTQDGTGNKLQSVGDPTGLTFNNNNELLYTYGGITLIGKYYITENENKDDTRVHIVLTKNGQMINNVYFDYTLDGNVFSGRSLRLSNDYNGTEYTQIYKNTALSQKVNMYKDNKTDKTLVGSWLYKSEDEGYPYTLTFNSDGTMEQNSSELSLRGSYTAEGGKLKYKVVAAENKEQEYELTYKIKDNKLTLQDNFELTKVSDKYAFKTGIK